MKTSIPLFQTMLASLTLATLISVAHPALNLGAPLGPELALNGGMEATHGWQSDASSSRLQTTNDEKHGGLSALHAVISRKPGEYPTVKSPSFVTQTGHTYRVRFWLKVTKGAVGTIRRNGSNDDQRTLNAAVLNNAAWMEYTTDYTELKGGSGAYIAFYAAHDNAEFYLDDISIREVLTSPEDVRRAWKTHFPNKQYVCWQKNSPWEQLQLLQYPPENVKECRKITTALGRNEYESASFVITNLSDQPMSFGVSSVGGKIAVTLRHALWVTARNGDSINDALALLDGPLVVPPGESREIWMTLHTQGISAGNYNGIIRLKPQQGTATSVVLSTKVYPVNLPEDKPLYTCYWDNVVPTWVKTPGLAREQMVDLKQHYANVALGHPWIVPSLRVDGTGKLIEDYAELDAALENYKALAPKMIIFNWNREAYFEGNARGNADLTGTLPPYMSDAWKELFKVWLRNWIAHLRERGLGYDQFAMYPDDENLLPAAAAMAKLIKETDSNINIYVNNMGQSLGQAEAIAPYVDIFSPYLPDYLNIPPFETNVAPKAAAIKLLKKKPEYFWTYANPLHHEPQESSPYVDYRLAVWQIWNAGMRGYGYFIYSYKSRWNSYDQEEGATWAVVYLADAPDAPAGLSKRELVVPGKRWEATREGVEDYVYLYMLKNAVANPSKAANPLALQEGRNLLRRLPKEVLGNPNDARLADQAKESILRVLSQLPINQK